MEVPEFCTLAKYHHSGTFDVWDGLQTCLHLMVGLYNAFGKVQSKSTLLEICQA